MQSLIAIILAVGLPAHVYGVPIPTVSASDDSVMPAPVGGAQPFASGGFNSEPIIRKFNLREVVFDPDELSQRDTPGFLAVGLGTYYGGELFIRGIPDGKGIEDSVSKRDIDDVLGLEGGLFKRRVDEVLGVEGSLFKRDDVWDVLGVEGGVFKREDIFQELASVPPPEGSQLSERRILPVLREEGLYKREPDPKKEVKRCIEFATWAGVDGYQPPEELC
jgi:hypothetical protein